ncbi:polymeric immunoglobulin receptor-like [Eleginops maclovinus]|uniref:polymeric immunoglobulin receptor-like n=1 Tax=Eleginops maclovinus TaxID=56733 RepID=UPI003081012E
MRFCLTLLICQHDCSTEPFLILAGLTGIHSIITASKVSVKAGGSITIPCLYESQYIHNLKYLCKGYYWNSCSCEVKTNKSSSSGKFLISHVKIQRIFTVTINDLTEEDTDYWCAVDINGGADDGSYFQLSVTKRGEITIQCHNGSSGEMKWCRLGGSCVTKSGSIAGTTVTISGNIPGALTVTMSGLRTESSGWYMCVKGHLQMPVHITVTEKPTTTTSFRTNLKPSTEGLYPTQVSVEQPLTTSTVEQQSSVSVNFMPFIIRLSLLIIFVMVNLFIWFMFRRCSFSPTQAEWEVRYRRRTSGERSHVESDVEEIQRSLVKAKGLTSYKYRKPV